MVTQPGKHDWPFASQVFAESLPWLAGSLHTPGDPAVPLRAVSPAPATTLLDGAQNGATAEAAGP